MSKPEDTTRKAQSDPGRVIAEAMIFGSDGAILRQEAQGQEQMVNSTVLPTMINNGLRISRHKADAIREKRAQHWPKDSARAIREAIIDEQEANNQLTRKALEGWGFKFGDVCTGDPMFIEVELPEGWERKPSEHSMWSYIVDDQGRERIGVFYKAAFYDRKAHTDVLRRFIATSEIDDWTKPAEESNAFGIVKDAGKEIWRGPLHPFEKWPENPSDRIGFKSQLDKAREDALTWANANLPVGWDDLFKAWDLP